MYSAVLYIVSNTAEEHTPSIFMVKVNRARMQMGYISRVARIKPKATWRLINQSHRKKRENWAMSEPMGAENMKGPFRSHYKSRPSSHNQCLSRRKTE
jgi:hypothetical protein